MALLAPDPQCRGVDIGATRYDGVRLTDVPAGHARLLKAAGYIESGPAGPTRGGGYQCTACGFRAFFRTCSRCGGSCTRN